MDNYDDNIGIETESIEYKEFTFYHCGLNIDVDDAIELITNNKWIFNKYVIKSLENMIITFLPKYTCAYLSSNIINDCELYFGVNNNGNIIGIPYQGNLDVNKIKKYIEIVYRDNIKYNGNIMNYVNISIIKLDNNIISNKNITPKLEQYYKYMKIYNEKRRKYLSNKQTWYKLCNRYNAKLYNLVNTIDTRIELLNYIEYIAPKNPILKLLKSNFKLKHKNMEYVNKHKDNVKSIYYWLTLWKDKMLQFVKFIKPKFTFKIPNEYFPIHILLNIKNMIPYWIKFNNNINLYVIKFTFKKQQKLKITYKNIYGNWSTCKRTIENNNPCCIHY